MVLDAERMIAWVRERELDQVTIPQASLDVASQPFRNPLAWRGQFTPGLVDVLMDEYVEGGGLVVDPFMGSGTTLSRASARGLASLGTEVNRAAVELARLHCLAALSPEARRETLDCARRVLLGVEAGLRSSEYDSLTAALVDAVHRQSDPDVRSLLTGITLLAHGDSDVTNSENLGKALRAVEALVVSMPQHAVETRAEGGDARQLPLDTGVANAVITSPPYINVFNYHQNYRKIAECLGWTVLSAARSEFGSNRKHRGNRFMTVVQYSMDLSATATEIARILKPGGIALLVVGRESRVRDVPFANSEIALAAAMGSHAFQYETWHSRKFKNRFGQVIYEDILVLTRNASTPALPTAAIEYGRDVGQRMLQDAMRGCREDRLVEIADALDRSEGIEASPVYDAGSGDRHEAVVA